ncbi:10665_t:CDS:2, partial [Paraglomus occultum]
IVTKIVEKYNLSPEMSVIDLSQYTSEFLENLTDDRKRNQARRRLRDGFKFSDDQKNVQPETTHEVPCSTVNTVISKRQSLLSSKDRVPRETIGEMAHRLLRDKLSIRDIRAEAYALALSAKNANA